MRKSQINEAPVVNKKGRKRKPKKQQNQQNDNFQMRNFARRISNLEMDLEDLRERQMYDIRNPLTDLNDNPRLDINTDALGIAVNIIIIALIITVILLILGKLI